MKVTPQITADFEEYPELGILVDSAIRRIVELMQLHDIAEIRRVRKTGVFDRPYAKDVVTPIGIPTIPATVGAVRHAAGSALLDYLETIGVSGLTLSMTRDEAMSIVDLWRPPSQRKQPEKQEQNNGQSSADPTLADTQQDADTGKEDEASKQTKKKNKEIKNG